MMCGTVMTGPARRGGSDVPVGVTSLAVGVRPGSATVKVWSVMMVHVWMETSPSPVSVRMATVGTSANKGTPPVSVLAEWQGLSQVVSYSWLSYWL